MPTEEDERAVWLSEANAIVEDWLKSSTERTLSPTSAAQLANRIARALQRAYEQGQAVPRERAD
jgi:hypothetical protein